MRAFNAFRRGLQNFLPGDNIAGHRDQTHLRMPDQMATDPFATAIDDIQHARRQDVLQCRHQRKNGQRGVFGRFEYYGVARRQRRCDLPRRHHQRVVPWRNRGHHANGVAADHRGVPFNIFTGQLPLLGAHRTGKETKHVDGGRQIVIERLMQWFAAVERLQTGQARGLPFDGIGNT
ncbi:hypothetical protein D3C78_1358600 [compost metagenome]